jgi:hypothetical protein
MATPYYLTYGDSVIVTVQAINAVGLSVASPEGSGAVIITYPDAPTNLERDDATSDKDHIGL